MPNRTGRGWRLLALGLLVLVILWLTGNLKDRAVILHSTSAHNQHHGVSQAS